MRGRAALRKGAAEERGANACDEEASSVSDVELECRSAVRATSKSSQPERVANTSTKGTDKAFTAPWSLGPQRPNFGLLVN